MLAAISLLVLAFPASVSAHELSVDQLRLWLPPAGDELRGQLTFDPELTRSLETEIPAELARTRVAEFVGRQLSLQVNGRRCVPTISVRELYEPGGASLGDVAMLSCPLSHDKRPSVTVSIGQGLPALVVVGAGMNVAESAATGPRSGSTRIMPEEGSAAVATIAAGGSVSFAAGGEKGDSLLTSNSSSQPGAWRLAAVFLQRGVGHVLPSGIDHLLFVAAITLYQHRVPRRLLMSLGQFTLAHTAAVAWAANGMWTLPSDWVEPCIAASIAVAGFAAYRSCAWLHASPLVLLFGLVHGLGFAGGLASPETGLATFVAAVVGFNVGVELAQLTAVLAVFGTLDVVRRLSPKTDTAYLTSWFGLAIAIIGAVWTLLRLTNLAHT